MTSKKFSSPGGSGMGGSKSGPLGHLSGAHNAGGTRAVHSLSAGKSIAGAMPNGQCNHSLLKTHKLQHSDYDELTGSQYNDPSYSGDKSKGGVD